MRKRVLRCSSLGLALLLQCLTLPSRALACVVGTGTGASCTEPALDACLPGGARFNGTVTFGCGPSPMTITVSSIKTLSANITIDGGSLVTLSGGGATRLFVVSSSASLANLTIAHGAVGAFEYGGAIVNAGGTLTVTNCTLSGNGAGYGYGGAIDNEGMLTVTSSTFSGNSAGYGYGGAIYNEGTLTVTDSTFSGNTATSSTNGYGYGGAIDNKGMLTVTNSTFSGNGAGYGGAIYNASDSTLDVSNSIFLGNSAFFSGGALYNAGNNGDGIAAGTLAVTDSTFSGNNGGAIHNEGGTLTVTNCTFTSHYATAIDNGIGPNIGGTLTVTNSTFSGNNGGAIYNEGGGVLATTMVTNSTFSGNGASAGAGGYPGGAIYNAGTLTLRNTIAANTIKSRNCFGGITDGGHNLDDGTSCGFSTAKGSLNNTDPKLDPAGLQNNGGPTQTIALQAGSPGINAGNETICAGAPVSDLDQRGYIRPGDGATSCSIGAYEYNSVPVSPTTCIGDCNNDGQVTIDELLTLVNIALGNADAAACPNGLPRGAAVDVALILQAVNSALNGCSR
jgi:predicted outer membrane repeat protein